MLYEALVIDNSDFAKTGKIRVRIKDKTSSPIMTRDLSTDPIKSIDTYGGQQWMVSNGKEKFTYIDTDVRVSSPIGGGYDYGVFYLPQPNSWGIVAQLGDTWEDDNRDNFVWMGALYQRSIITKDIHIPSEYDDKIISGVTGNGEKVDTNISNLGSSLIIKTKTTKVSDDVKKINQEKSKKSLNWKTRPTENLIVIDKDKIRVVHNVINVEENDEEVKEEKVAKAEFIIDKNGFNMSYEDIENENNSNIKLDNTGNFEIIKETEKISESIIGDDKGISASYNNKEDYSASMQIGQKRLGGGSYKSLATLSATEKGKSNCYISVRSDGIEIESSGDVNISPGKGGKVTVGSTNMPVLVSPTGSDLLVGNVTIPCSKNLLG